MFGIEAARTFTDLQRTISNAIKRLLNRIEALEMNGSGADPQVATNTANIATNTADITALDVRVTDVETDIVEITPKWALLTVQATSAGSDIDCPDCPVGGVGDILRVWNNLAGKNTSFISNSSGTLTINESGTYRIRVDAYTYRTNQATLSLFKNASVVAGSNTVNAPTGTTGGTQVSLFMEIVLALTASDELELYQNVSSSIGGSTRFGFRVTSTTGVVMNFASLFIEKIS